MVLAGILESLLQPFVIMLTLPLGLIGVIWALFLTGNSISMLSLMSLIMLIGIVVNNAILMIDYAHMRRRQGDTPREAIENGAANKFKPILMMNLAIMLAMLPQALGLGSGAELRAPFAITAIGGILVSTLLTLFVIPTLYVITAKKHVSNS
jgi:HAE1 family hydrophobic/amphiphilic exporter-1